MIATPNELRQRLALPELDATRAPMLRSALGSVAIILGDDKIEAEVTWFDPGEDEDEPERLHLRVFSPAGVIAVDHEFSFDGLPHARLTPWSQVESLQVIADRGRQSVVLNAWLTTKAGQVELAGGTPEQLAKGVRSMVNQAAPTLTGLDEVRLP